MQNIAPRLDAAPVACERPSFDSRKLRDAAGQFASGVTVVTVETAGAAHGMTANSFICVSLEPPLVLVAVDNRARILRLIAETGRFGISVLSEQQRAVSQQFAGRGSPGLELPLGTLAGVPVLPQAIGRFACRLYAALPGGDHTLVLGEVLELDRRSGDPLLFFGGCYRAVRNVDEELVYASLF